MSLPRGMFGSGVIFGHLKSRHYWCLVYPGMGLIQYELLQVRQRGGKFVVSLDYYSKGLSQNKISKGRDVAQSLREVVDVIPCIAKAGREVERWFRG